MTILMNGINGSGGTSNYNDLSNKPQINGVTLTGNKTTANLGLFEQVTSMPSASAEYVSKPVQYMGTTTSDYTQGCFYVSVAGTGGTYTWTNIATTDIATTTRFGIVKPDADSIKIASGVISTDTVNNVTSTSTTKPLSANMGKSLQEQITNLKNIGRFLAIWNCTTGLPTTDPTTSPYTYKTGDYYRVGTVAASGGTNYKPNGSTYTTGVASTTVETEDVEVGWVYYYDGTSWLAQSAGSSGKVQDVQINGTTILDLTSGIANIPVASSSDLGTVKIFSTYGTNVNASNQLYLQKASDSDIEGKSNAYKPVVSNNLDKAVMEGLGNNSLTWTDAYKTAARTTIGAAEVQINGTSITSAGVANIPKATGSTLGTVIINSYYALTCDSQGYVSSNILDYASYQSKNSEAVTSKGTLENVLTNETVRVDASQSLTTAQQEQARTNIGAAAPTTITYWD